MLACLIPLVWPGDIPFINDEPQLIANAVNANRDGRLASLGLLGTYGFIYGPAPTWVYQALVAVSRDLVVVAVLHALLLSAATAGALWWLSRSLGSGCGSRRCRCCRRTSGSTRACSGTIRS